MPSPFSSFFRGFQPIAEIQQLILRRTIGAIVDGPARVSNQAFKFETVHRNRPAIRLWNWPSGRYDHAGLFDLPAAVDRLPRLPIAPTNESDQRIRAAGAASDRDR